MNVTEDKIILCPKCSSKLVNVKKGLFKNHKLKCVNIHCKAKYYLIRRF